MIHLYPRQSTLTSPLMQNSVLTLQTIMHPTAMQQAPGSPTATLNGKVHLSYAAASSGLNQALKTYIHF